MQKESKAYERAKVSETGRQIRSAASLLSSSLAFVSISPRLALSVSWIHTAAAETERNIATHRIVYASGAPAGLALAVMHGLSLFYAGEKICMRASERASDVVRSWNEKKE